MFVSSFWSLPTPQELNIANDHYIFKAFIYFLSINTVGNIHELSFQKRYCFSRFIWNLALQRCERAGSFRVGCYYCNSFFFYDNNSNMLKFKHPTSLCCYNCIRRSLSANHLQKLAPAVFRDNKKLVYL